MKVYLFVIACLFPAIASARGIKLEVGKQYFNTWTAEPQVITFLGHENDKYIFRYESGRYTGRLGYSHISEIFASMSGCLKRHYCVGDQYAVPSRHFSVGTIVGIESNGRLILHFDNGSYPSGNGSGWHPEDLVSMKYRQ